MASRGSEQQIGSLELQNTSQSPQIPHSATPIDPGRPTSDNAAPPTATAGPGHRRLGESLGRSLNTIYCHVPTHPMIRLRQKWNTLEKFLNARGDMLLKLATILAFLITAIAMWPSISSANDGHKAELIAEWTARKDFIEACEAHDWSSAACEKAKGMQLEAPPNFDRTEWKRYIEKYHKTAHVQFGGTLVKPKGRNVTLILSFGVPLSACLFVSLRHRLARAVTSACSRFGLLASDPRGSNVSHGNYRESISMSQRRGTPPAFTPEPITTVPKPEATAGANGRRRKPFIFGENDEVNKDTTHSFTFNLPQDKLPVLPVDPFEKPHAFIPSTTNEERKPGTDQNHVRPSRGNQSKSVPRSSKRMGHSSNLHKSQSSYQPPSNMINLGGHFLYDTELGPTNFDISSINIEHLVSLSREREPAPARTWLTLTEAIDGSSNRNGWDKTSCEVYEYLLEGHDVPYFYAEARSPLSTRDAWDNPYTAENKFHLRLLQSVYNRLHGGLACVGLFVMENRHLSRLGEDYLVEYVRKGGICQGLSGQIITQRALHLCEKKEDGSFEPGLHCHRSFPNFGEFFSHMRYDHNPGGVDHDWWEYSFAKMKAILDEGSSTG